MTEIYLFSKAIFFFKTKMFSTVFKMFLLVAVLILVTLSPSSADNYNKCPETSHERYLIYQNTLKGRVIHVRIPGTGFFHAPITCLQVTDINESFSTPVIEEGGYGKEYVVLRIDPVQSGEQLQYDVQIYVDQ
ncbi:uncharacterized protein LOC114325751 [Diabrotica virgifera virgifera]|uniref:Uncharacterized protein LOC114325751 n=1 Tax=Diabrotica virgifera virgifera TaxID=50390 RepID=A0A6P7F491_DIAVI|nr:uncharacterized protein LOC114325751 [Diabrotica virgifera virgifera]